MAPGACQRIAAAIVAGLGLVAATETAAEPVVQVRIDNSGCVASRRTLDAAKLEALRTYSSIGVSLVWTDSSTDVTGLPSSPFAVTVLLLSRARTDTFLLYRRLSGTVLAVAPPGTRRIFVFCERIQRRAIVMGEKAETILGRVIAHEIGHHLLPANGHSTTGIMRASLDYRTEEPLRFTEVEANSILARLAVPQSPEPPRAAVSGRR